MPPRVESAADLLRAAHRFYGMGALDRALEALDRLPPPDREGRDERLLRGACLARMRRKAEAVSVLEALLTLDPECHEALTWMAVLVRDRENMEEALGYARRAVALRPDDASGHGALGTILLAASRPDEAAEAFARAVELAPGVAEHRHNLGQAYLTLRRHGEAIAQLREAATLAPRDPQSYLALASAYGLFGMAGPALDALTAGLGHLPDCAPLHTAAASAYAAARNDAAAERHHRRAVGLDQGSRGAFGSWLVNQGRFEEAETIFEAMIEEGADPAFAYYGLTLGRRKADAALVLAMETLLSTGLRPRSEMYLHYALGWAEEGRGLYGEAMAHFDAANRLAHAIYHGGRAPSPQRFAEERLAAQRLFESIPPSREASAEAPIFIVGMIRSGTTLLDQIVSSHPEVASGGELRFWLEEARRLALKGAPPTAEELRGLADEYVGYAHLLADTTGRFTDKMPLNFEHLGTIHRALPNARFLHIRRHPVDTCLSIWTTFFGQGPLFAYDKASVVAYYREYRRAMDFWREEIPADRLLEIDYEALIDDPEPTIRRVVEFCGLPWDDACLRHDQNEGAINTPSRWQARQPIYRTSLERWRRYEPWLGEFAALGEAV